MDRRQSAARLAGTRPPVDLCAELVIGDGRRCLDGVLRPGEQLIGEFAWSNEETVLRVGGRWDPNLGDGGDWSPEDPDTVVRYRVHRGQEKAARRFAEWLPRYAAGKNVGARALYDLLLRGGRRGGKTHLAGVFVVLICVALRRRIVHALSAIQDTTVELQALLASLMPAAWYGGKIRQRKNEPPTYVLANGSRILMLSGGTYHKQGRVDVALLNEMQDGFPVETYDKVRAPVSDTGGLLIAAFNPADESDSLWVDDKFHAAEKGQIPGVEAYQMFAKENPLVVHEALDAMRAGMDPRRAKRELDGEDVPIGDAVMIEWVASEHHVDPPAGWPDITAQFLVDRGQLPAAGIVGMDFQGTPFMCGRILQVFEDPEGRACPWITGECDVEGDEERLSVGILEIPPDPALRLVGGAGARAWPAVIDASGWWQDGAHTEGRTSDRVLRGLRWDRLLRPQVGSDKNPAIKLRMRNANRLLRSGTGVVLLRVAKRCTRTAQAFQRYKLIRGEPARKSEHAHPVDAATYPLFRFFPPPYEAGDGGLRRAAREDTARGAAMRAVTSRQLDRRDDRRASRPSRRDGW